MEVVDVQAPEAPGPGEVLLAPEAVGLCGSDFHYFLGDIGTITDPSVLYPRIQGHEAAATIVELGADCPTHLATGMRVAIWPVAACGHCYPCRIGRGNACVRISLTGIHADGALQERLVLPSSQVFPVGDLDAALTALIEPVSIAVRAVERGRVAPGEHVVILGAGPIGQALALAAIDRGASAVLVDRVESRLARGIAGGADLLHVAADDDLAAAVREWSGGDGPEVVFEATGVPAVVQTAIALVAQAGRVVVVGLSHEPAAGSRRRPAVPGARRARNELLRLGRLRGGGRPRRRDGGTWQRGWSPTSSRSSARPRRSCTRWSTRPRS